MRMPVASRLPALLCATLLSASPMVAAHAQLAPSASSGSSAPRPQPRVRIGGLVHDSITGFPLSRAVVQLVEASGSAGGRMVISDSFGRYAFDDVPAGRYTLGFHHPVLDSLGLEPLAHSLELVRDMNSADLAVPSAVAIREAVCGAPTADSPGTLLMGFVRDAATRTVRANADVTVEWLEFQFAKSTRTPRIIRRKTTTGANGWFGVCNIPREGFVQVVARVGADSSDHVEIEVASDALQRRELFVGPVTTTLASNSEVRDSSDIAATMRTGTTRISGVVLRQGNGRPLENASVRILNGPATRTNAKGEFVIENAPAGTRQLDVRAVGFYPQRTALNVLDDAPSVRAELVTFKSVLDTVKVLANYDRYSTLKAFEQRVRSGVGRYITPKMIAQRNVVVVSELFWTIPGVYIERAGGPDQELSMRGIFAPRCSPSLFLNAFPMQLAFNGAPPLSINEIDTLVRPGELLGIEIYTLGQVPGMFGGGMNGCGAIALWTR